MMIAQRMTRLLRKKIQEITPSGAPCLLEMLVMEFGLCIAPSTFTRLMTHVVDPFIHLFVIVYLDDICIYSKRAEEHLDDHRKALKTLRENELFIKMMKYFWVNRKPNILVSLLEVAIFEHPNQRLQ